MKIFLTEERSSYQKMGYIIENYSNKTKTKEVLELNYICDYILLKIDID